MQLSLLNILLASPALLHTFALAHPLPSSSLHVANNNNNILASRDTDNNVNDPESFWDELNDVFYKATCDIGCELGNSAAAERDPGSEIVG
jgi:hypothetical protein